MSGSAKAGVKTYPLYINGQWVNSSTGEMFPVYDPSTEEIIANVAAASSGSALLEVDLGAGIDCLPRGEPEIAGPDKNYHHAGSKNEGHTW